MLLYVVYLLTGLNVIQANVIRMSCKSIKSFVDGHNSKRLMVAEGRVPGQPAASHMNALVWDEELAKKAENWASQNKEMPNPDINIGSKRFLTGENLFFYSTNDKAYKLNPRMVVETWFDQHKFYKYGKITEATLGQSSLYTQMVWDATTHIGCGMSKTINGTWKKFMVVCYYGPIGNENAKTPYRGANRSKNFTLSCTHSDCKNKYGKKCKISRTYKYVTLVFS